MTGCTGEETYQAPEGGDIEVKVSPDSKRLQLLEPFAAWDGKDIEVRPWSDSNALVFLISETGCTATRLRKSNEL